MCTHRIRCLLLLVLLLQLGCLPTVNPLITNQDCFFDPMFLGNWAQRGQSTTWSVTHRGDRSYRVVCVDDANRPGQFVGQLAKIENELYLDLIPDESVWKQNQFERIHTIPIHTIYRVEIKDNELTLHAIDFKQLEQYLEKHPDRLPSITWGDRRVITASTAQLQAFVKEHSSMFGNPIELVQAN